MLGRGTILCTRVHIIMMLQARDANSFFFLMTDGHHDTPERPPGERRGGGRATTKPRRRATAEDVARAAGVSRSAVSRVYTPGAYVSPEKRARVHAAADKLGYRPNALAASLNVGSSNLVAIVTGSLVNHYDGEVIGKLVEGLSRIGKWPVVLGGTSDDIRDTEILDVLAYPLDALVIRGGSVDRRLADHCAKLKVPLIISGRVLKARGVDCVCCDNAAGIALAVRQFVADGRTRIAYLGGLQGFASEQERYDGFQAALAAHGRDSAGAAWADFSFQGGYTAAFDLLSANPRPDALVCCNDAMALGVLGAADTLGIDVPGDLGVIGFDDIEMAAWPCFQLTTVRNPLGETVDHILRMLESRQEDLLRQDQIVRLDPQLVLRATH